MTPVQSVRSDLLKLRNIRRLQRAPMIAKYLGVGLNADVLNDDRTERLAALLAAASPSSVLEHVTDWVPPVLAYVNGLSELTIGEMWDWEASMPMCRVSASSIAERPEALAAIFPSGFFLVGEGDSDALAVDLDFDEHAEHFVARAARVKLYPRGMAILSEGRAG
jgi:hypothetical protein